ncbi:hypothetical protein AZF37_03115 [endosymbiont 'TC1' of Trimyema compressum]|uniref:DUF1622 domain-containing protein n=1 Tax=endosymbiont 'TC1' of Trimyema compressum TaxID=243899 RepID=UPI0007F083CE|nr:DUF1622 domain-containing protein [endosymbiont 'TC1' of Trimyema compressum]AMP20291.1 hypothetical protein AZF37_03115 [endosymbiont 'TC1' of Trimyema compressum]
MEQIIPFFEVIAMILNVLSILVISWGVLLATVSFLKSIVTRYSFSENIGVNTDIKNNLGSYILLGLEILICADIIQTILNPNFNDILMLASIVVIRTVISFFFKVKLRHQKIKKIRKINIETSG